MGSSTSTWLFGQKHNLLFFFNNFLVCFLERHLCNVLVCARASVFLVRDLLQIVFHRLNFKLSRLCWMNSCLNTDCLKNKIPWSHLSLNCFSLHYNIAARAAVDIGFVSHNSSERSEMYFSVQPHHGAKSLPGLHVPVTPPLLLQSNCVGST